MQSGIKQVFSPQKASSFFGGICRWWYVPVHWISYFPPINPTTQTATNEPTLISGARWIGPVAVPDKKLGWEETAETSKPGVFYKQKVSGFHPGDTIPNRILMQNMAYCEFVVVAQLRSDDQFVIIGNQASGLSFDHLYKSGAGGNSSDAGSEIAMIGESTFKAPVLPYFSFSTLPNRTIFRWGFTSTTATPSAAVIESWQSDLFPSGSVLEANFTGDNIPRIRWVAVQFGQPEFKSWFSNYLNYGSVANNSTWRYVNVVALSGGQRVLLYRTNILTAYPTRKVQFYS